jgi:hypothetical protein
VTKVLVFLSSDSRSCVSWRIRQQGTKDSAGRLGAVWHKVNRWNQRAKFRWVSRLFALVYILSCYRIIDFNCKLCTVCSSSFWSINSQITRLVIWGETYSDKRVDDAQSGELPNHIVCLSLSLSFNFVNFVNLLIDWIFVVRIGSQKFNWFLLDCDWFEYWFVTCLGLKLYCLHSNNFELKHFRNFSQIRSRLNTTFLLVNRCVDYRFGQEVNCSKSLKVKVQKGWACWK